MSSLEVLVSLLNTSDEKRDYGDRYPPANDPSWGICSIPVYEFLSKPRSWEEMTKKASELKIPMDKWRHLLAWLKIQEKADCSYIDEEKIVWYQLNKSCQT